MNISRSTLRRKDQKQRQGAMILLVAAMLAAVFGMCAFSVDLGYLAAAKATLSASADAGALAAAGRMSQSYEKNAIKAVAVSYAQQNVPEVFGSVTDESQVTLGVWDPNTRTFTPDEVDPNAVRVVVERSQSRGNAVPAYLSKVFNLGQTDLSVEAIAVGAVNSVDAEYYESVYVTSTKHLSNIVLEFEDGSHQKFEDLGSIYTGTFQGTGEHAGKRVVGVWIKSGQNSSNDGPGYGERIVNTELDETLHGENEHHGAIPHVTATFQATGAEFSDSGSISPVRLVN